MTKRILNYLGWIIVAILLGFLHMRIVLGPASTSDSGGITFLNSIHDFVLWYVGAIIGAIIAFVFILLDILYLNKKLQDNSKATLIRLSVIIGLAILIGATHYFLEEIADVI